MKTLVVLSFLIAGIAALTNPPITGKTPAAVPCPNSLCNQRKDGNYRYHKYVPNKEAYFVQCVDGKAHCQSCWPQNTYFKEECNQCVYNLQDPCYTTVSWVAQKSFDCPDLCPKRGPKFRGNIHDPHNGKHYVGCWDGMTVGCVPCPANLLFNEKENACLFEGKYLTKPLKH